MFHEDFKIISGGRELPYPWSRLLLVVTMSFAGGYLSHFLMHI